MFLQQHHEANTQSFRFYVFQNDTKQLHPLPLFFGPISLLQTFSCPSFPLPPFVYRLYSPFHLLPHQFIMIMITFSFSFLTHRLLLSLFRSSALLLLFPFCRKRLSCRDPSASNSYLMSSGSQTCGRQIQETMCVQLRTEKES